MLGDMLFARSLPRAPITGHKAHTPHRMQSNVSEASCFFKRRRRLAKVRQVCFTMVGTSIVPACLWQNPQTPAANLTYFRRGLGFFFSALLVLLPMSRANVFCFLCPEMSMLGFLGCDGNRIGYICFLYHGPDAWQPFRPPVRF